LLKYKYKISCLKKLLKSINIRKIQNTKHNFVKNIYKKIVKNKKELSFKKIKINKDINRLIYTTKNSS